MEPKGPHMQVDQTDFNELRSKGMAGGRPKTVYGTQKGNSLKIQGMRGSRKERNQVRYSPLSSDMQIKEFVVETRNKLKDKSVSMLPEQPLSDGRHGQMDIEAPSFDGTGATGNNSPSNPLATLNSVKGKDTTVHEGGKAPSLVNEASAGQESGAVNGGYAQVTGVSYADKCKGNVGDQQVSVQQAGDKDKDKGTMVEQSNDQTNGGKDKPNEMGQKGSKGMHTAAKQNPSNLKQKSKGMGFDFSKALKGAAFTPSPSKSKHIDQPTPTSGSPFTTCFKGLEDSGMDLDGRRDVTVQTALPNSSSGLVEVGEQCTTNMQVEHPICRVLPDSLFDSSSTGQQAANGLSEYKRTTISDYITVTNAVPMMVANAWDSAEWIYFAVQCHCRELDPDYVVVDDDSFIEDYLLDDVDMPPLPEMVRSLLRPTSIMVFRLLGLVALLVGGVIGAVLGFVGLGCMGRLPPVLGFAVGGDIVLCVALGLVQCWFDWCCPWAPRLRAGLSTVLPVCLLYFGHFFYSAMGLLGYILFLSLEFYQMDQGPLSYVSTLLGYHSFFSQRLVITLGLPICSFDGIGIKLGNGYSVYVAVRDMGLRYLSLLDWKGRKKKENCLRWGNRYGPAHKCPETHLVKWGKTNDSLPSLEDNFFSQRLVITLGLPICSFDGIGIKLGNGYSVYVAVRDMGLRYLSLLDWKGRKKKENCLRWGNRYGPAHKCPETHLVKWGKTNDSLPSLEDKWWDAALLLSLDGLVLAPRWLAAEQVGHWAYVPCPLRVSQKLAYLPPLGA
ncbi:hypothetical protein E3N88_03669 [Mikania micrantha]|uniref:Uncharacterized protein n=1 Tax=Mikania micrantha TaxID=192012 RepID=A0A5N6Q7K3_9ASTR|nr:hypothetical protein E3N88_03669 [Mikania micrantha]